MPGDILSGIFGDDLFGSGGSDAARQAALGESKSFRKAARRESRGALGAAALQRRGAFDTGQAQRQAGVLGLQGSREGINQLRRGEERTAAEFQPFLFAGTQALPELRRGSTISGVDSRLREIFDTEQFKSLFEDRGRALQGQLAAGGLTRSGTALEDIASLSSELGLGIENRLFGRTQDLTTLGFGAATGLANLRADRDAQIANLRVQGKQAFGAGTVAKALSRERGLGAEARGFLASNQAQARGFLGAGQAQSSGIITGQQADAAASQDVFNAAASLGSVFFSDPGLKENIRKIGEKNDLSVYQWDWIPEAKGTIIESCPGVGFMADEVLEKYPQHVKSFGGFMVIAYPDLLDELG